MARERLVTMDGVRGVAAICVMLGHYTLRGAYWFPSSLTAVDIFFCLSGFVIAHAYEARLDGGWTATDFARARLIRLYPLFALGLALGLAEYALGVAFGGVSNGSLDTLGAIARSALFLPTLTPFEVGAVPFKIHQFVFPFNNAAWSLTMELAANAVFLVYRPRGWRLALVVAILAALFIPTAVMSDGAGGLMRSTFLAGFPRGLYGVFAGVAVYRLWTSGWLARAPRAPLLTILSIPLLVCLPKVPAAYLLGALLAAPTITALSLRDPISPTFGWICRRLGEASYPVYVLHLPLLGLARFGWNSAFGLAPGVPLPTPVALVLAATVVALSIWIARRYDAPVRKWLSDRTTAPQRAPVRDTGWVAESSSPEGAKVL